MPDELRHLVNVAGFGLGYVLGNLSVRRLAGSPFLEIILGAGLIAVSVNAMPFAYSHPLPAHDTLAGHFWDVACGTLFMWGSRLLVDVLTFLWRFSRQQKPGHRAA